MKMGVRITKNFETTQILTACSVSSELNGMKNQNYVSIIIFVMRCAISHHSYNLKNVKNTHGGVLILVKLIKLVKAKARNFTKINSPQWVFFTFFKLYEWYEMAQRIIFNKFNILMILKFSFIFQYRIFYNISADYWILILWDETNKNSHILKIFTTPRGVFKIPSNIYK